MKIDKSLELWKRGAKVIPCGTQTLSKGPDQFVFGVHPIYLESGKGCIVTDVDGNKYIDHICSLGPIILGHNHKRTKKAIIKQLKKGITFSLMHSLEVELAELLCEVIPCADQVRFAKNGTDAVLAAVRLARSYTGKEHILKPEGHYHGWGDWHASSMGKEAGIPKALKDLVDTFPYNDARTLEGKLKTRKFAALIMEPVQLEPPCDGFLYEVRRLCTEYGVVLIFDEMITGFRWALGGAQEGYGVTPDLATFGKAVANGMPLSIVAGKKFIMQEFDNIFFSMTFGGEACSLAAALETVKELKENKDKIYPHIWKMGNELMWAFDHACELYNVKGKALGHAPWHNVVFDYIDGQLMKDIFHQEMVKNGILYGKQIYTTWAHKEQHINKTVSAIYKSVEVVGLASSLAKPEAFLSGKRSSLIFKRST